MAVLLGRGHDGPGVVSEAFASLPHDRFDQVEVVRRRGERDVSHRGGQDRQFGLRIGALAVPAQQGVDGMGVPYVVKACRTACDADNGGVAEQAAEAAIDPAYGIGAGAVTAVGQQRGVRSVRATATGCEIPISGGRGTVAESHEARLVALRPAHEAGTLVQVAIAERKPDKFPATQAGGIGERNRLTVDRCNGEQVMAGRLSAALNRSRSCCSEKISAGRCGPASGNPVGSGTKQVGSLRRRYRHRPRAMRRY